MANSYVDRSVRRLFLSVLVIASLATACKKSGGPDAEIDPRDQYVGTYSGTYRNTLYIVADIFGEPRAGTATATITKGSNSKEIYIELTTSGDINGDRSMKVTAELNGVNFTVIDKNTDSIPIGNPISSDYTASGVFDPNSKQFSYASVANGLRNGAQYKQTYEIVATRQ